MQVLRTSIRRRRHLARPGSLVLKPAQWQGGITAQKSKLLAGRSAPRRITSILLLATGGILCTYVAGSYTWMYAEQRKLLQEWKVENRSPAADRTLSKIAIPRIGLRAVLVEGTSSHSLLLGPAHMVGTAVPGTAGNAVILGHRDTFFRNVYQLRSGDAIYILRGGKEFRYTVVHKTVVEPTDLSVLRPAKYSELTLITCYPTHAIGPAPERLVIVARLR
jgi:sortase A